MNTIEITADNIKYFIRNGVFENGLTVGISKEKVIQIFGNPPLFRPQKKKNKAIMGWGALNIYLYSSIVTDFSINNTFNYLDNLNMEMIDKRVIIEYLKDNSIYFDDSPYILDDDEDNIKYILSNNDITFGFCSDKLFYISQGKWEHIK
ncbi:MAG: hypothetical protein IJ187_03705 [Neisseriaceae bacterium]|nr:hypothetical protein [Neisseriaceae bacterium]